MERVVVWLRCLEMCGTLGNSMSGYGGAGAKYADYMLHLQEWNTPDLPSSVFSISSQKQWLLQVEENWVKRKKKSPLQPGMSATLTWYYTCWLSPKVRLGAVRMRTGFAQLRKNCHFSQIFSLVSQQHAIQWGNYVKIAFLDTQSIWRQEILRK